MASRPSAQPGVGVQVTRCQDRTAAGRDRDLDEALYPTDVSYDASIPTPESFLGRPLGSAPVRHHELVDYINRVAALSDRLTVEIAGYTHERRPILFVVATSPDETWTLWPRNPG